jgi:hypothetical protein
MFSLIAWVSHRFVKAREGTLPRLAAWTLRMRFLFVFRKGRWFLRYQKNSPNFVTTGTPAM